jgi:AcrR family transcriptional regulator
MSNLDQSTEEKIKEAARVVFTKKGYAAARTRDIAEEAGINLSLLNYYFRSKEKLFHQIITEKVQQIFGVLFPIMNNEALSLDEKIDLMVVNYIDLLHQNPDLPLFILSELKNHPQLFEGKVGINQIGDSSFVKQLRERRPDINPIQFMISLLGLTIFPFVGKPMIFATQMASPEIFDGLMEQRKVLIPKWIKAILDCK